MRTTKKRSKEPVWISPALHRRLKRRAAAEGRTMRWLGERAIEALLARGGADGLRGTIETKGG